MNRHFIICLLFCIFSGSLFAQTKDAGIEQMMTKRALTQGDVNYNIVCLVPDLYKAGKLDTVRSLIAYYERNYGAGGTVIPLKYIMNIAQRSFKEEMKAAPGLVSPMTDSAVFEANIMNYLDYYRAVCTDMSSPGKYAETSRPYYMAYFNFLSALAVEQLSLPGLTPVEKFLLNYYQHPSDSMYSMLASREFNGTILQRAWLNYYSQQQSITGISIGGLAGVWMPLGNLSLLGPHPYIGFIMGGKSRKFTVDMNLNFRFLRSASVYNVVADNILYKSSHYFGGYFGVDGGYELFRKKKNEIDLLGGIAFEGMDAFAGSSNKNNSSSNKSPGRSINSVNFNIGLGYRIYVRKRYSKSKDWSWTGRMDQTISYVGLQAKYNFVRYDNEGGTDMRGNAFTFGIIYGGYTRAAKQQYGRK